MLFSLFCWGKLVFTIWLSLTTIQAHGGAYSNIAPPRVYMSVEVFLVS